MHWRRGGNTWSACLKPPMPVLDWPRPTENGQQINPHHKQKGETSCVVQSCCHSPCSYLSLLPLSRLNPPNLPRIFTVPRAPNPALTRTGAASTECRSRWTPAATSL